MSIYRRVQGVEWAHLEELRRVQNRQDDDVDALSLQLYRSDLGAEEREDLGERLADELHTQATLKREVNDGLAVFHKQFHPTWGQLFKAGFVDSRFAKQVLDYACVYATRASDLGSVSPLRDFRAASDFMPHDQRIEGYLSGSGGGAAGSGPAAGLDADQHSQGGADREGTRTPASPVTENGK